MTQELPTRYEPASIQADVYRRWLDSGAFAATPDDRDDRYVVMMPLPNVTGALHMGHAMDNVMQDLLIRWHRMRGDNTLWMPGTDHAGIATQAVVEKRLFELEGKTRHDLGREGLVERIWRWKNEYQQRIVQQQQAMGCSCDWDRQRFTMDDVCSRAVRETFFRLFRDGLIYRGNRLVNWDCMLQTAVSDDEVYHETVDGHFWHLRYPVIDPAEDEPTHVVVATTRPETMLGDTAVAVHPDPAGELAHQIEAAGERLKEASPKDRIGIEQEIERLESRRQSHLPDLEILVRMARDGRLVRLPLLNREIPLVLDEWAKPGLGSGCVKITPGHDSNDYEVWQRHQDEIGIINILEHDGTLNRNAGAYAGQDRFDARKQVVSDLESQGLLEAVEARVVEIGHSDRSKTPVEPFLSEQWFVRMRDVEGGILLGRGTENESRAAGLAQAAIDAVSGSWRSATGRTVTFHPDHKRYSSTYSGWLSEKRDWCISRQLWWGHRIPIWMTSLQGTSLSRTVEGLKAAGSEWWCARVMDAQGLVLPFEEACDRWGSDSATFELQICVRDREAETVHAGLLESLQLQQDADVLDTWFSSAIWPHSTLGWPDPVTAPVDRGQPSCTGDGSWPDTLAYYYPGSCLVTARDIITLWVARMVIAGLYNLGDLPFTDVFIHANILDGKGERMSKSKGNGIDPVDIIETYGADAMRYVLCDMQTGTQDIRLPVQAVSPFTGNLIDLAQAKHGRNIFTYICPESGQEFDVMGTVEGLPAAKIISDRFEAGRNFCNKLWNAARFALMNVGEIEFRPLLDDELESEDRWILSRLERAKASVTEQLESYNPSAAIGQAREFFWSELCDWYLELIKPRLRDETGACVARAVLATALDQVLRLLHPFIPFVTESIWERLRAQAPVRGLGSPLPDCEALIRAPWPEADADRLDEDLEAAFVRAQTITRAIRDIRSKYDVPPKTRLEAFIRARGKAAEDLKSLASHIASMAGLSRLEIDAQVERPALSATQVVAEAEIFVSGVLDPEKERARLEKQRENLKKRIGAGEGKLANEGFLSRAPEDVVASERRRVEDLKHELARVEENLQLLA